MEYNRKQSVYKVFMLVLLSVLITALITATLVYKNINSESNTKYVLVPSSESSLGTDLSTIRTIIEKYYLGEVDDNALRNAAITGYVSGLGDEYSSYITKEKYESFSDNILGNFVGIGIYMSIYTDTEEIVILYPIKGSPAEAAGLKSGDVILKVDGTEYKGEAGLELASKNIKGEEGTKVKLEIKRDDEILNFEIERAKIIMNPVQAEKIEGTNVGYIKIASFDENCANDFKEKYTELRNQDITSLIIDLRNNGGGIVKEALEIADYIVPKDKDLLITVNKTENETIEKSKNDPTVDVPVVVLVNGTSASASEILLGALIDNNCAKAVGTKTYGKGVIQEVLKLKDGSALKLTTEEYFTPNKTKINKIGITPDEIVELPENAKLGSDIDRSIDTQLNRAIEMLEPGN